MELSHYMTWGLEPYSVYHYLGREAIISNIDETYYYKLIVL